MHYNVSASKQGWLGIYRRYILLIYIGYISEISLETSINLSISTDIDDLE